MELREIGIFLVLADELHFGRTAERLGVSPGRISQVIKQLESRVGAPLFVRTSRQVTPTPVGRQLRDDLAPGYQQIKQAIAKATANGHGITGVLRVGFSGAWCGNLIVATGDLFQTRYPGCEIQIQEAALNDRFGPLRTRELDLQLTEFPADEPDVTTGPVIFSHPRALTVPAAHPLAGRESVSLEDLTDYPLITIDGPPQYFLDFHLPRRTPLGRPIPRGPATTAWQEVLSLVSAGKAVCPTSIRSADYYSRPELAFVPFHDAPTIDFGLTWLTSAENTYIRTFVQTILEVAADFPGAVDAGQIVSETGGR
ncbi:LysR family transcriptional regulator [Nocardia sp. NBC_01009]|uniref:LysR family transcriptional regulator n=1 Tax=Nocardia sp. NBC_01009 TaxID=2975996 RepID=UPI003869DEBE|nr:LysR family transcriptional regulator [Nocardia sp. NBC_01009]